MRLLEILILLTPIPYFLWPVISKRTRPSLIAALPFAGIILLLLHLVLEGYRWQVIPAYGLTAVLFLAALWRRTRKPDSNGRPQDNRRVLPTLKGLFGILLVVLAAVLPAALPIPKIKEPTGPYQVGTTTYHWIDSSRQETFGPEPGGPRELMVQIWYPAEPLAGAEPASWYSEIEIAGPALANTLDLPSFLLNHLVYARTHSVADAPLADFQAEFPVLIFSHGLGGIRVQSTFLMEALASEGYIVASIDHTYGGAITVFPDGRTAVFDSAVIQGDANEAGNTLIHIWAEDGRFVLGQLAQLNEQDPDGRFTNRLRLDQIGYVGHSTGGGTAFLFCLIDDRCGAGVALDGWLNPISPEIDNQPIEQPFLFLKAEDWSTPENSAATQTAHDRRQTPGEIITLPGTRHYNFSDLPLLSPLTPQLGLAGPANGPETLAAISAYTITFFNTHLRN